MQLIRITFLVLLVLVPALASAKRLDPLDMPLPELEVIPGASSQWVGRQMAHNGMPMSIRMFTYPGEEGDVAKFYRNLFRSMGHGESSKRNLGEYRVIGYELRRYIYSVQYRQVGDNVEGKLTVSPVPGRFRRSTSSQIPTPPGCHVLNKVESIDYGRRSETLTVNCEKRLGSVEHFYATALESDGWLKVIRRQTDLGSVMDYQRGSETLQVTVKQFTKKNKRLVNILINWVK